ncbi:MAG: FitA-like ribbon-helix-helix domain-containing protein [Betaproteobacteria bacterium]
MSSLVIKNLPDSLHARLKRQAERNRRSVIKEAVRLLEAGLETEGAPPLPASRAAGTRAVVSPLPAAPGPTADGRAALRAALIEQPDGSYTNVLGIEDDEFFATLARLRAPTRAPEVERLFGDAA